jgi:quinol monooxygenase YgiN
MVSVGLIVRLKAKSGRELDVENLLRDALEIVDNEPATTAWFACRLDPATFAIFDAFPDDDGRQAHLSGGVGSALMERAHELLDGPPTIERADLLAAKLPGVAVQ